MFKKLIPVYMVIAFSVIIGCDNTTESSALPEQTALRVFDNAFTASGSEFSRNLYEATNKSILDELNSQDNEFWVENPVLESILNIGLSGASTESINALMNLIYSAILNPWSLLDTTSFNGQFGCITWSTGVDFDLQMVQAIIDLYNQNWWNLTVRTAFNNCPDITGQLVTEISGSRLGIVYRVHVAGNFTVPSMPGKNFSIDVVYDLEDCFKSWDCVDWEGTINGYNIKDLY